MNKLITRSASSWRVKWWKFVLKWSESTTATAKGPARATVLAGVGAWGGLLWYGLYGMKSEDDGMVKKKSFAELYPDPRLKKMHQEVAIPNIMFWVFIILLILRMFECFFTT